jgi:hypothetical protein
VKDFSWINLDRLKGIGDAIFSIMSQNPAHISENKAKALAWAVNWRVGHLIEFMKTQKQNPSSKRDKTLKP